MQKTESLCQEILKRIDLINDPELKSLVLSLVNNQKALTNNVFIDPLTGIYNRRIIPQIANCNVAIMCDIDNFKLINDTYGHSAGDKVLQYVAEILKKNVRPSDYVCRYGGDEFFISLAGCSDDIAIKRVESIQQQLLKNNPLPIALTLSIGIASKDETSDIQELINKTDNALYYSKLSGKNTITILKKRKTFTKNLVQQ